MQKCSINCDWKLKQTVKRVVNIYIDYIWIEVFLPFFEHHARFMQC